MFDNQCFVRWMVCLKAVEATNYQLLTKKLKKHVSKRFIQR
ncbi:hypothetical protein M23134_01008 [Microscilla marina ATCC 23134]|uniref:Uncharacterized protein n=1 Tax=Microscilla marina ATCC 23134 TaxID=313606 RepID=A1ZFB0_MICM2|nr:hypothetical protein M23134_01008 [Microscilla marina ATCC 23134]